jgi:hypothetical protein
LTRIVPKPLFVFGVARSGTNLIAALLNAHSAVRLALDPLMPYFKALRDALVAGAADEDVRTRYPPGCPFQDNYFVPQGRALLDIVLAGSLDVPIEADGIVAKITSRAALESPETAARLGKVTGRTYRELLDSVLATLGLHEESHLRWCGSKEVWTTEFIPVLARAYPDARFIVIRRDPRAIISSLLEMGRKDPSQAAHTVSYMRHWRKEAAVVDELLRTRSLTDRILIIRYEDLAEQSVRQYAVLADFLQIALEPFTAGAASAMVGGNSSYEELRGISAASIARWREMLFPDMVRTVEFHCAPEMLAEGYRPAAAMPVALDESVRRMVLAADASAGSWRSDSGNPHAELDNEIRRWSLLSRDAPRPEARIVQRHFIFEPFFARVRSAVEVRRSS